MMSIWIAMALCLATGVTTGQNTSIHLDSTKLAERNTRNTDNAAAAHQCKTTGMCGDDSPLHTHNATFAGDDALQIVAFQIELEHASVDRQTRAKMKVLQAAAKKVVNILLTTPEGLQKRVLKDVCDRVPGPPADGWDAVKAGLEGVVPEGSYQGSCSGCKVDAQLMELVCNGCIDGGGVRRMSRIKLAKCAQPPNDTSFEIQYTPNTFGNHNGGLICDAATTEGWLTTTDVDSFIQEIFGSMGLSSCEDFMEHMVAESRRKAAELRAREQTQVEERRRKAAELRAREQTQAEERRRKAAELRAREQTQAEERIKNEASGDGHFTDDELVSQMVQLLEKQELLPAETLARKLAAAGYRSKQAILASTATTVELADLLGGVSIAYAVALLRDRADFQTVAQTLSDVGIEPAAAFALKFIDAGLRSNEAVISSTENQLLKINGLVKPFRDAILEACGVQGSEWNCAARREKIEGEENDKRRNDVLGGLFIFAIWSCIFWCCQSYYYTVSAVEIQKLLCAAIREKDVDAVRKLLTEDGADPSVPGPNDRRRQPPLYLAAEGGNADIVKLLLERNANPNKGTTGYNGTTPLQVATQKGHTEVVGLLKEHGTCVICYAKPKNATIVHGDSGHGCCCLECATTLKERGDDCPICRASIDLVIKQYN